MGSNAVRVMLASDQPDIRRYMGRVVKERLGGVVVGEGENAVRALRLARRLRPDVAIIDSYLPHQVGLNNVPLSHSAGLDTAQAIFAEIPNVRVLLVDSAGARSAYPETGDIRLWPTSMLDMVRTRPQSSVIFTGLPAGQTLRERPSFSGTCFTVGAIGLLVGMILTATMFLAYLGLPLMFLGGVSLFIGCVGRLVAPLLHRWTGGKKGDD